MVALHASMRMADIRLGGRGAGESTSGICSALKCIRGVADVSVEPQMRLITVTYDASKVLPRQFETAVRVMGGEAEHVSIRPSPMPGRQSPGLLSAGRQFDCSDGQEE
jgi:hypothetical protein